jgi:hypothetical protein
MKDNKIIYGSIIGVFGIALILINYLISTNDIYLKSNSYSNPYKTIEIIYGNSPFMKVNVTEKLLVGIDNAKIKKDNKVVYLTKNKKKLIDNVVKELNLTGNDKYKVYCEDKCLMNVNYQKIKILLDAITDNKNGECKLKELANIINTELTAEELNQELATKCDK